MLSCSGKLVAHQAEVIHMANELTDEVEMYTQAAIAAILTLTVIPQTASGNDPKDVVHRYKEVLEQLRTQGAWYHRGPPY